MKKNAGKTLMHFFSKMRKNEDAIPDSSNPTSIPEVISAETESQKRPVKESQPVLDGRDPLCGQEAAFDNVKNGPFQPLLTHFPETKGRKFRSAWYSQFIWLEYSVSGDKAFCFPCRLYGKIGNYDEAFICKGFNNWKKATQRFQEHGRTTCHLNAMQRWQEGLKSEESVAVKLSSHHREEVKKNREYLKILFETLNFLGRQGLGLRGHREEEASDNRGNYLELLKLRSKDNALLKKMFVERGKYFSYVHHDVQNEMLEILSSQIRNNIVKNVKESKYFSVIMDETPDVAHHEQVSLLVRYISEDFKIYEKFLGFYKADHTDGESLYDLLLSALQELDLEPVNIVAQCYDGAANMSGRYKGVATRLKEMYPHVLYVHCYMHALNLNASPKRHSIFEKMKKEANIESNAESRSNLSLKTFCETRFSRRYESLRAVHQHLDEILETLEEMENVRVMPTA